MQTQFQLCSYIHACTNELHYLANLQDLITTLVAIIISNTNRPTCPLLVLLLIAIPTYIWNFKYAHSEHLKKLTWPYQQKPKHNSWKDSITYYPDSYFSKVMTALNYLRINNLFNNFRAYIVYNLTKKLLGQSQSKLVGHYENWLVIKVWVSCGLQSTPQSETQSGNLCILIKALLQQ